MEMDTAIRHQLPIVVVMSNNGGFTSRKTGGNVGRELGWQRYDKMVEALGGYGEFVEKPDEIEPPSSVQSKAVNLLWSTSAPIPMRRRPLIWVSQDIDDTHAWS